MGLFSKKTCEICGGKAGLITRNHLADDSYICSDCQLKCSPELTSEDYKRFTPDGIRQHMKLVEENAARYAQQFQPSIRFSVGITGRKDVMLVDEAHGWWVNAARSNPDIFTLDQIATWRVDLETTALSDEEKEKISNQGVLEWLFSEDTSASYPEIPRCPRDQKVTGVKLRIGLRENPFGVSQVILDLSPSFFTDAGDIQRAYQTCHEINQYLTDWKNHPRGYAQPAAQTQQSGMDGLEQLKKLKELLDMGVLTQAEFDAKKKQILGL